MLESKVALLTLAVGTAGLVGIGALGVRAHGGFGGHRHNHEMVHKFVDFAIAEKLDAVEATELQKQRVFEIKRQLAQQGRALHDDRELFVKELLSQLERENPDPDELKALVRQRTEALARLGDEAAAALVELHGRFTPEQRGRLLAELREHVERHHR